MGAYFLADTHLGSTTVADARAHERRVCRWLEEVASQGSELWMLGDILDYWYEYRTVVPRGHVRLFGALARLADKGVHLHYIVGNHDIWLRDYLRDEIGMEVLDGIVERQVLGTPMVMAHGDGLGPQRRGFRMMRRLFRSPVAQWLYSGIHPRWTIPFAQAWSGHSRATGESAPNQVPEAIIDWAAEYCHTHQPQPRYFVMGHIHRAMRQRVPDTEAEVVILGDGLTDISYARLDDDGRLQLLTY